MREEFTMTWRAPRLGQSAILLLFSLALTGCAVTWLSKYDSQTDEMTTALQRAVAVHGETLGEQSAPACLYDNHRAYYTQEHADVGALELRVAAIPKNEPTKVQVEELKTALNRFESLHKSASASGRCQSPVELQPALTGINQIFRAILTLEIAKKRGEGL